MIDNDTLTVCLPLRSINKVAGYVRRCIEDYDMIRDGETIAVGVSGGKDSLTLLCALASLRAYYPKKFKLHAVTLDMGFQGMDFAPVKDLCASLNVPYTIKRKDFGRLIFEQRAEKSPCALCSKMRRGALHDAIIELGIKKLALAHHFDDAVETLLLSLFYEGRVHCFRPVTYMDRAGVTQIRPMIYVKEDMIKQLVSRFPLDVVENTCPMNGESKREEIKTLIKTLGKSYPDIKQKLFGAMQRYPLEGWNLSKHNS